jgi:hypothetical protein
MYVETHDNRDYDNWNHFTIPLAILDAKDPLKAAQEQAEKVDRTKEINQQEQIRLEIERLQGLLK